MAAYIDPIKIFDTRYNLELDFKILEKKGKKKTQLHQVTCNEKIFQISQIWINNQPAKFLKKLEKEKFSQILECEEFEDELHIQIEMETITIHINPYNEKNPLFATTTYTVNLNLKALGLIKIIKKEKNISSFNILTNDNYDLVLDNTLSKNGIKTNDTLKIIFDKEVEYHILREESSPLQDVEFENIKFTNLENTKLLKFINNAPTWRRITRGLNLEGSCTKCEKKNICVPLGFSNEDYIQLDVASKEAACPCCSTPLENVHNCILWDCEYIIEGFINDSPIEKRGTAPRDKALSFYDASSLKFKDCIIEWNFLKIKTYHLQKRCTIL